MNHNQSIQYLSWLFVALITPSVALAGNKDENDIPWYQVEIIIFANQNQQGMISETWPDPRAFSADKYFELIHPNDSAILKGSKSKLPNFEAGTSAGLPTPYELMSKNELQLMPIAKKLDRSGKYKVLMHAGWRQPTLHPDESQPVFVYLGVDKSIMSDPMYKTSSDSSKSKNSGDRFSTVAVGSFTYDSSQYGQIIPASPADVDVGPMLNPFYGTLRLSVSRYLHLEANLNYRTLVVKEELLPVNLEDSVVGTGIQQNVAFTEQGDTAEMKLQSRRILQNFNMHETRRMRSKELHYFDHPLMGIIVRVVPYEITIKEPDFDPASQAFTSGGGKPAVKSPQ